MAVAHPFDLPSLHPAPATRVERSGTVVRAVVLAALAALILALIGCAYFGAPTGDSYRDLTSPSDPAPFPLWAD